MKKRYKQFTLILNRSSITRTTFNRLFANVMSHGVMEEKFNLLKLEGSVVLFHSDFQYIEQKVFEITLNMIGNETLPMLGIKVIPRTTK